MEQHAQIMRHAAEAAGGAVLATGYWWLPLLDESVRIGAGIVGIVYAVVMTARCISDWRRDRRKN